MNRPQYFNTTPAGFRDVPFVRPVTFGQDVTGGLAPGRYLENYVVQLDNDAPQVFRSWFWQGENQGEGAGPLSGSIQVRLRDAFGNFLTDGYIPLWLLAWGAGSNPPDGGSGRAKVFEPELYCPAGSILNPDGSAYVYPGLMEFRGVKRFPEGCS
jgi:hypothetical protein